MLKELQEGEVNEDGDSIGDFYTYGYDGDTQYNQETIESDGTIVTKENGIYQPDQFNDLMQKAYNSGTQDLLAQGSQRMKAEYADQLMPFDITVNFLNEMGEKAKLSLFDVEILNQGMGVSIQDLSTNVKYSFIARDLEEMTKIDNQGNPQ